MRSIPNLARFGGKVRSFRYHLDLYREGLAERADLHRTYIAGVEGGGRNKSRRGD
jgi:predicted transcriptional regulator